MQEVSGATAPVIVVWAAPAVSELVDIFKVESRDLLALVSFSKTAAVPLFVWRR